MGKKVKKPNPKHRKPKLPASNKPIMKDVFAQLAQSKTNNQNILPKLHPIAHIDAIVSKKKDKTKKLREKKKTQKVEEEVEEEVVKPKVNIFAVDEYLSEKKVQVKMVAQKGDQELDLVSRARKVMGDTFIIDKFGDKPMKIIEEKEEVALSEDQQETLPHPGLPVPEGHQNFHRTLAIRQFRTGLPIYMKQQELVDIIGTHLVTLVCGETGSGKSTQLPQFLVEKNYHKHGKIGITQPRRLATTALATRVAEELKVEVGKGVGYQVRHDRKQSQGSYIKFMTDGILLKEMSTDSLLSDYSVIVIDEAHERKLNTDILIGLLSKLILIRYKMSQQKKCYPLRLVIMSATLRIEDFQNKQLFNFFVPIVKVEARMFPVTIYHEKNTPESYVDEAIKKCVKIHKRLPQGDVLVFLTGKEEIHEMIIRLENELMRDSIEEEQQEEDLQREGQQIQHQPEQKQLGYVVLPLYSSLPTNEQEKIFKQSPGCRKFIISTNIAETSVTVPNVRYVIDCGKEKERYFDGVWKWKKGWGTKAMASQRAGRAGRTAHGYCYRLYSSALYANIMDQYPTPQINKHPLAQTLLQLKQIGFTNVYGFPFPTTPPSSSVQTALSCLREIKAIEGNFSSEADDSRITELGKVLSFVPLEPRLAKMLLLGSKQGVEKYILLGVMLMTVQSIFQADYGNLEQRQGMTSMRERLLNEKKRQHEQFTHRYEKFIPPLNKSDIYTCINILGHFFTSLYKLKSSTLEQKIGTICQTLHLNSNVMRELYYNSDQIAEIYTTLTSHPIELHHYEVLSAGDIQKINQIMLMSFPKQAARHVDKNCYEIEKGEKVYVHQNSCLYKEKALFLGYVELVEAGHGRKYLQYPFVIDNYQLFAQEGQIGEVLDWKWRQQTVVGVASATVCGWEVPNVMVYDPAGINKYYAMARMVLEGKVFNTFKILQKKNLLGFPPSIISPDNLQEKVQKLVHPFRVHNIQNKQSLILAFENDPHFLEKQLKLWVNSQNYGSIYQTIRKGILQESKN